MRPGADRRRHGFDPRLIVPGLVVLAAVPLAYAVWLAGGEAVFELDRLSIVTAVVLRIGLWICLFVALDGVIEARRTVPGR